MNKTFREHWREEEKMSSATTHGTNCHHGAATTKGILSPIVKSLLLLCALTVSFAAKAENTPLFETPFSTTYNNTTLSMPYRIPALVETVNADGEKELIYFGDKRHCGMDIGWGSSATAFGSSYYRIDIVARRSTDGGASWTAEETIQQGTASCGYGDVAVVSNHENPKEIMFMAATGSVKYGASTYSNPLKTTRFYSSDGGQNWSTTNMTSSMYSLISNAYSSMTALFFTSGRICQSKHIKVGDYYRIYSALCVYNGSGSNAFVVYSDDFGASWNVLGGGIAVSGGDESAVEELPNGNVLISSRKTSTPSSTNTGRRYFRVFEYDDIESVEEDEADGSWEANTYSGIQWGGSWKGTNGELLLVPAQDANGDVCYIMLHSVPYGTGITNGRDNVSIFWKKLSSDEITSASEFSGTSWNRYSVSTTTSAYSTMILQHDGTVSIAYEENQWGYSESSNVDYRVAPTASGDLTKWSDLGYNLMYQNFTLAEITNNEYSYYAGEEEEDPVVETVATPAFSLAEGEYEGSATVEITCTTDGATIYYTLDGSTPTTASAVYGGAITLTESATVSAIAVLDGYNDSEVATATYTIKTVSGGDDDEPTTTVTKYRFKNVQVNGTIYYFAYDATNGLTLTSDVNSAHLYTREIVDATNGAYNFQSEDGNYLVWKGSAEGYNNNLGYAPTYYATCCDLTVKTLTTEVCHDVVSTGVPEGYVYITGKRSDETSDGVFIVSSAGKFDKTTKPYYTNSYSSAFIIEEVEVEVEGGEVVETVATPVISPNGGEVESGAAITITCTTEGATIYYTLDGTTPSASNGTEYTTSFALTSEATIKAIAILNGYNDSEVATASFTIKEEEVVETEEWVTSIISCDKESCSAASYSTLYLDYAVKLPSGVKAYRGVLNKEEATLTLYQIKTGIVPALCAVIIENTHVGSSITLTKTTSATTYTNDLQGTLENITDINPSDYYVLGHTAQYHLGFYHPNSTTLAANKAYIEWSSSNARALTVKRGDDDDTTAIDVMDSTEDTIIYDLMGRRVSEMLPGRIYIVNGVKTIYR